MSITFSAIKSGRLVSTGARTEPCLCTQMGSAFIEAMDLDATSAVYSADLLARLRADANPSCPSCRGSGVETYATSLDFNLSNVNARLVARQVGLVLGHSGSLPLETLALLVRPVRAENARLGLGASGSPEMDVESHGNHHEGVLTPDGIAARLERLGAFLDAAAAAGADEVSWG